MRNNPHEDKEKKIMENMNIKILVVDDESRMRKLVKDFLAREGYTVLEAGDGMEAMDIFYEVLRDFFIKKEYLKGIVFYNLVNNFDECINNNKINIRKVTKCVLATDYACLSKELKIGKDYLSLIDEIKSMKHDKLFKLVKKVVSSFSNDKKLEEKLCY